MAQDIVNILREAKIGDTVVSVSDVLKLIGNRLTAREKEDLLLDIAAVRRQQLKPGDLITAATLNDILLRLTSLEQRMDDFEQGSDTGGGGDPAIGTIDISHEGGSRGTKIIPGDPKPFPQTCRLINATNRALRIMLTASISAPTGNWKGAAVFENGAEAVAVNVPAQRSIAVEVLVSAPGSAVIGETAKLTVEADVGAPHNKHAKTSADLTVALAEGPPVSGTLELGTVTTPIDFNPGGLPAGVDGRIPRTKERTISYQFKYATQDTTVDPGFEFVAQLSNASPAGALAQWSALIAGAQPDRDDTDAANGVRTLAKSVTLTAGLFVPVALRLIAPDADTQFKLTVFVRSTRLPSELTKSANPLVIESR